MSYTWDDGEEGAKTTERPAVWIRKTGEEVRVSVCGVECVVGLTWYWTAEASELSRR